MPIELGYVAINLELRAQGVFTSRSTTREQVVKRGLVDGVRYLQEKALANLADLMAILEWNEARGIRFYRITSTLFSHIGDEFFIERWPQCQYFRGNIRFAAPMLRRVGEFVRQHGHRVDFHALPYCALASPSADVRRRAMFDIRMHHKIAKYMSSPPGMGMILHIGGSYGDMAATCARWVQVYKRMPERLRRFIFLENTETNGSVAEVMRIHNECGVPIVLDFFHNEVSADRVPITPQLLMRICATWRATGVAAKFHYSEQRPGARPGAHSDDVRELPRDLLDFAATHPHQTFWLMLETKNKEKSVLVMRRKYNL